MNAHSPPPPTPPPVLSAMLPTALATDPVIRSSSGLCDNHGPAANQEAEEHLLSGLWANHRLLSTTPGKESEIPRKANKAI